MEENFGHDYDISLVVLHSLAGETEFWNNLKLSKSILKSTEAMPLLSSATFDIFDI